MDELTSIRAFVSVVEHGSFSAAARQRNITVSSIARQVNALEELLGVRLLNRTTRHQSLTEAGALYYEHARDVVRQLDNLRNQVSSFQDSVKGTLRVQLRTSAASDVIVPALPSFLSRYPELCLDVDLNDDRVDLVENGIDVAVWLGNLQDTSTVARRLSAGRRVACGSPAYFAKHGEPKQPEELVKHNCLIYDPVHYGSIWRFTKAKETHEIPVAGSLQTRNSTVLMSAAVNGLGVIVAQEWMVQRAVASGRLQMILTDYEVRPTDFDAALYAVYPSSRRLSPKTKAFVEFLVGLFKDRESAGA
ncbi:MAG: LysR family transcriptional regulator [Rhizobiales bacterium]|nr:LysR family transcriptional regulator [Hyphomicrobiales bacterium]